jgi:V/A-type H+-transporting ATPase subunit E
LTGLEKILDSISSEADENAKKILKKAEEQIEEQKKANELKKIEKFEKMTQSASQKAEEIIKTGRESAKIYKNKLILEQKQKIIKNLIQESKNTLYNLPKDKYFSVILNMIKTFALPLNGEIVFCERDLKNLPEHFEQKIEKVLENNQKKLKISQKTRKINGGFVLVYQNLEENCSLDALFENSYNSICDLLSQILAKN